MIFGDKWQQNLNFKQGHKYPVSEARACIALRAVTILNRKGEGNLGKYDAK